MNTRSYQDFHECHKLWSKDVLVTKIGKLKLGSKNSLCEGYSCILSKEFESTKELEAVAKFDQNIFLILLQLDALVVGENMLLVKRSFSNLDLLHPVLRARQSWQILFNARTVQLASWGWPWGRLSAL